MGVNKVAYHFFFDHFFFVYLRFINKIKNANLTLYGKK